MSCALIAGVGPVPPETPAHQMAPGLRLWSLARIASLSGGEVVVASHDHFGPSFSCDSPPSLPEGVRILAWRPDRLRESVAEALKTLDLRCVVATTDLVSAEMARQLPAEIPLWVDLYGDPLAEGQLLAAQHAHDGGLGPLGANMLALLTRADRFSACSRAHRRAMLGQLGLAGRHGAATASGELVSVLPALLTEERPALPAESPLRGPLVGPDDIVVLWSGGFNTWTDGPTLFEGLRRAMVAEPRLHFVCLGGKIDRHSPGTYGDFAARVEQAPERERFHLLGWRPRAEVAGFCAGADVGLNIDAVCHEAELGTRTRLLDWAQWGLAICSTPLSEMTRDLDRADALESFAPGDPQHLADALVTLARDPDRRRRLGENARRHAEAHWTPETAGSALAAWLRDPVLAADRPSGAGSNRLLAWMRALEPALRSDQAAPRDLAAQARRLRALEGSRLIRLLGRFRRRG